MLLIHNFSTTAMTAGTADRHLSLSLSGHGSHGGPLHVDVDVDVDVDLLWRETILYPGFETCLK